MKKKNRMKNKQVAGGCENEGAGEIDEVMDMNWRGEEEIDRKVAVELSSKCSGEGEINRKAEVELDRKCGGEDVELNKKCSGKEEINRMAVVKLDRKCSGEDIELNNKCSREEEINRMAEVELNKKRSGEDVELDKKCSGKEGINREAEVELNKKCSGEEESNRKVGVELNGKRSGEEQGVTKAELGASEIRNLVATNEGKGVGEVNEKREGGVEVNTVMRRNKRRSKGAIEVERKRMCMGKVEIEMKGEVNEKCEVDVIDRMDADAGEERGLVRKDEDGRGVQMSVEVGDQKQDVEGTKVREMKLLNKKHKRWLAREKARYLARQARRLAAEANQNKQEDEKADKEQDGNEGASTNVENKDGEAIIKRVGGKAVGGDGDVEKKREIVVEKQEGEASGKHEERVAQEEEMKGGLNETHEVEVNDRMDVDAGEERDLVQKDEDGGGVQMSVEEAAITRPDGLEFEVKPQGIVHIHMQEGQTKLKQEEVNHKEGKASKLKKKNSKQPKPTREKAIVGNQWRQSVQNIGEDSRAKLMSILNQFSNSLDQGE